MVFSTINGYMGMGLRKNSPYTPFLKMEMMKIIDAGHMVRLKAKYDSETICDQFKETEEDKSLSYQKLIMLFIIMGGGILIATLVLMHEILKNYCKRTSTHRVIKA